MLRAVFLHAVVDRNSQDNQDLQFPVCLMSFLVRCLIIDQLLYFIEKTMLCSGCVCASFLFGHWDCCVRPGILEPRFELHRARHATGNYANS